MSFEKLQLKNDIDSILLQNNAAQMKLYLILMGIGVILSFLQIITVGVPGIASAIISAIIASYFFICIYSLYKSVKGVATGTAY